MTESGSNINGLLLESQNISDDELLANKILSWAQSLKENVLLVAEPSPIRQEPFKNIYKALEEALQIHEQIQSVSNVTDPVLKFRLQFADIQTLSALGKWHEQCDNITESAKYHKECLTSIQHAIENSETINIDEIRAGVQRCHFMYIYENTRFAIVCSERDEQSVALEHLVKAEELYHKFKNVQNSNTEMSIENFSTLSLLDSLNSETLQEMFTYVLFYLGQAYKISGDKEKAILYLHAVLRRELEKHGTVIPISWSADARKMSTVLVSNFYCFEAACDVLLAATAAMNNCSDEEKDTDDYKQHLADLGRCWAQFGNSLLEASCDRLKDLQEQTRKPPKFQNKLKLTSSEIQSLGIDYVQDEYEYDTVLLINSLNFPSLSLTEVRGKEMKGKFVRDFDEARACFLPLQRWINNSKSYYKIDEYASDYIDIITDYSNAFKHLAFFEPSLERQVKMHKRRILLLEELLSNLSPTVYIDVFHFCLRELAEINETVYKLKVSECKERGLSLKPKDKKFVRWLTDAIGAYKRNLENFKFDIRDPVKNFDSEYEKLLLGSVLSIGRILGSISHDHPLHPDALDFAIEGKKYYEFFLQYLDNHLELKTKDFATLYQGTVELPALMLRQIKKISEHRVHNP